jgi:hypothetical protein
MNLSIIMILFGCGIESKIDQAASRCEAKIANALKYVENACFTKEEILELVRTIDNHKDIRSSIDASNNKE